MKGPRILLWDTENTHNLAAVFQLVHNDYISPENIIQERHLVCAAWKTLGEQHVHAVSLLDDPERFAKDITDDFHVIKTLHDVLSEADVIVAHNGDMFDIKMVEGRMLRYGLSPLPPIPSIDTLKVAKSRFLLNSNKLDYLGTYLGLGNKVHTDNTLWLRVLQGEKKAIREMVTYNKQDVTLLEGVFLRLRPYAANHPNAHLWHGVGCPRCGSMHIQSRGIHRATTRGYPQYQCMTCGGYFRDLKSTIAVKNRVL